MRRGELISEEQLERWQERGLIRSTPLPSGVRRVRADEFARLPIGPFTGFAPLREDHDVVQVERARPLE